MQIYHATPRVTNDHYSDKHDFDVLSEGPSSGIRGGRIADEGPSLETSKAC